MCHEAVMKILKEKKRIKIRKDLINYNWQVYTLGSLKKINVRACLVFYSLFFLLFNITFLLPKGLCLFYLIFSLDIVKQSNSHWNIAAEQKYQ